MRQHSPPVMTIIGSSAAHLTWGSPVPKYGPTSRKADWVEYSRRYEPVVRWVYAPRRAAVPAQSSICLTLAGTLSRRSSLRRRSLTGLGGGRRPRSRELRDARFAGE